MNKQILKTILALSKKFQENDIIDEMAHEGDYIWLDGEMIDYGSYMEKHLNEEELAVYKDVRTVYMGDDEEMEFDDFVQDLIDGSRVIKVMEMDASSITENIGEKEFVDSLLKMLKGAKVTEEVTEEVKEEVKEGRIHKNVIAKTIEATKLYNLLEEYHIEAMGHEIAVVMVDNKLLGFEHFLGLHLTEDELKDIKNLRRHDYFANSAYEGVDFLDYLEGIMAGFPGGAKNE